MRLLQFFCVLSLALSSFAEPMLKLAGDNYEMIIGIAPSPNDFTQGTVRKISSTRPEKCLGTYKLDFAKGALEVRFDGGITVERRFTETGPVGECRDEDFTVDVTMEKLMQLKEMGEIDTTFRAAMFSWENRSGVLSVIGQRS